MAKKIVGWIMVIAGVLAIGYGIWSSYSIFTAKKPVPEIFNFPQASEQAASKQKQATSPQDMIQQQLQQTIQEQLKNVIPSDFITRILNLASWSIFMAILVMAAGKISSIGANLLKS